MANPNMKVGMPSVNPKGRPSSSFQNPSDRRAHFLETLSRSEILTTAADDEKLDEYSSFDAQIIIGLADTLKRTPEEKLDPSHERERFYDRQFGKSQASVNVNHSGAVAVFTADISPITDFLAEFAIRGASPEVPSNVSEGLVLPSAVRTKEGVQR